MEQELFLLPDTWYVVVTKENKQMVSQWRGLELSVGTVTGMGIFPWGGGKPTKEHNFDPTPKFGQEITFEQFKKYVLKMEDKQIMGYKVPYEIFVGSKNPLSVGSVVVPVNGKTSFYASEEDANSTRYSRHLPKEVVETWEPVYKNTEETIDMGSFNLVVKDNKVFHKNEDITNYVKELVEEFTQSKTFGNPTRTAIIKEITFSKTGCESNETKLSDWMKVYNLLKKEEQTTKKVSKTFSGKIQDRVKTVEDAFELVGLDIKTDLPFPNPKNERQEWINWSFKLDVVNEVLNEGWVPDYSNSSEYKYYPYFDRSGGGFRFRCHYSYAYAHVGARLVYRTAELAEYAGTKFVNLYKEVYSR